MTTPAARARRGGIIAASDAQVVQVIEAPYRIDAGRQTCEEILSFANSVNGGVTTFHWGGAKVGHFGARALERVALI